MASPVLRARIAFVRSTRVGRKSKVLEWKPRFAAVFVVLTLVVVAAIASGYFEFVFDNWEW
jgi:hypothetical protein